MSVEDFEFLGIRGLGGRGTSVGVDELAGKLVALGLNGKVINQENAVTIGSAFLAQTRKVKIIFGFSMGATDAIDVAQELIASGHKVAFLFTMDPHLRRDQVGSVDLHINVYQENPLFGIKPFFPVAHQSNAEGVLRNVKAKDVDSHGALDNTPWVHDLFLEEVMKLLSSGNVVISSSAIVSSPQKKYDSLVDTLDNAWSRHMDPSLETEDQRRWQKTFFDVVRTEFGGLSEAGVEGIKSIIFCHRTFWSDSPVSYLAWFLGNIRREVGGNMQPIKETQKPHEAHISDKQVVARLNNWWASGAAQRAQVSKRYWLQTAAHPFGRGLFQTTWHENYKETREVVKEVTGVDIPFDEDYNLMLDPLASAIGAFAMSLKGNYRGKPLINFLSDDGSLDYHNARTVLNGDTKNYALIAGYCRSFEKAIRAAEAAVPGWLANTHHSSGSDLEPQEPVIIDEPYIDFSEMDNAALIQHAFAALEHLATRENVQLSPPLKTINSPEASGRGANLIEAAEIQTGKSRKDNQMNFLDNLPFNGSKTILGFVGIAAIAILEGPMEFAVPDYVEQLVWSWTGVAGAHKVEKLVSYYRDMINNK